MTIDVPTHHPTKKGLESDLAKVLTAGVGHPIRKVDGSIRELEVVAKRLSDPSFPPLRQVEEVVREAINLLGTGPFAIATALVFGAHGDTANKPLEEIRRPLAAKELGVSEYTLKHDREERMRNVLADDLLKRYSEAITQEAPPTTPDRPPLDDSQAEADPARPDDVPSAYSDEAEPDPVEPTEEVGVVEAPYPRPSARTRRRHLAVATTALLLAGGIVALLVTHGASSAHHHTSAKTLPVAVGLAPFSPNRSTYDYDIYDPSNGNCDDPNNPGTHFGRCGALKGHVLNSFINTPTYGDERYFFGAGLSSQGGKVDKDPLTNVTIGSTVVLWMYVDNNTAVNLSDPRVSDTHDTRVRVNLKSDVDEPALNEWVLRPEAFISASNAQTVEDGINLVGPEPFALEYEAGSAQLLRDGVSYPLGDGIVSNQGALIGLLYMNGDLPAGDNFDAAAYIELHARVVAVAPPEIRVVNQVRMAGSHSLHHTVNAKPGDYVEWLLHVSNGNWSELYNVVARDVLPSHMRLDSRSVTYVTPRSSEHLTARPLFSGGFNLGNYAPRAEAFVTFKTTILEDFPGCQIILRNLSFTRSDQTPVEVSDDADVVVMKPKCSK